MKASREERIPLESVKQEMERISLKTLTERLRQHEEWYPSNAHQLEEKPTEEEETSAHSSAKPVDLLIWKRPTNNCKIDPIDQKE